MDLIEEVKTFTSNKDAFPEAPKVFKTYDYGKFNFLHFNREVNQTNLNKLVQENKKKCQLHKFPILVDKQFNIVDGQHRFTCAKEIGAPVYYIQESDQGDYESIVSVNRAGKVHTLQDMVFMAAKAGDEGSKIAVHLFNTYNSKVNITTIARVLSGENWSSGRINERLRDGQGLRVVDLGLAKTALDELVNSELEFALEAKFITQFVNFCKNHLMKPKEVMTRLRKNAHLYKKCATEGQLKELLYEMYNYRLMDRNKVFYTRYMKRQLTDK